MIVIKMVHKVQGFGVWVVSGLWLCNWMTKQPAHPNFSVSDEVPSVVRRSCLAKKRRTSTPD